MLNEQQLQEDEEARSRIARDLDTTFLVEAGAGSGKTTSIVGRMIALIRERKAEVRNIAAITFTNKAAAELMSRFRLRLEQEFSKADAGPERDNLEEAMRQVPECFIGTIHAFCGRLLRERPIEAGLDPGFREMDDLEDSELRDRCWDEYLDELRIRGNVSAMNELSSFQINVEDLRAVYNRVSEYEDVEIYTEQSERPDFDRLRNALFPMLEDAAVYIPTAEPEKGWDDLQKIIRTAQRHLRSKNMADDMNVLIMAKLFDRNLGVTLNRWTDSKMAKQIKERFHEWQTSMLRPFLQDWREFLHPKLIDFVLPAVRFCRQKRTEAGKLNFQDLLMKAAELLRSYPEVRQYFVRRYSRLFVDEFQDTDPIQAEMMMLLTGADEKECDWRKQLPRPGSLFVVGDPKQSIYRFRRADISTYNFVKMQIAKCGDVLQLTRNFRSVKSIGDFVNYGFENKFAKPGGVSDYQAPFVHMMTQQPNPQCKASLHGVYTLTVPKQEWDRQLDITLYDAERVAQFIAWACDGNLMIQEKDREGKRISRPAVPGDFLILLKFRRYINLYAELLDRYWISSDTSGSQVVSEELLAISLLVQALNDPTDQVPLLAVLRGMLFGVSDDELYHYRREGGSISLYLSVDPVFLSEKGMKVEQALQRIRHYSEWVSELPALAAFTRIVDDIGLIPAAAAGESGAIRSGTLIKLLELLQAEPEASAEWQALTDCLGRLTDKEGMEAASLFSGSGDAVRIMNLHKAKGLEAPVVLLASPCGNSDHDASEHVDRLADPALGYFTISKQKDSFTSEILAQPVGWAARAEREREFMHAETERLLYVATTRAKQLLVVSQYPARPAIDPWSMLAVPLQHQLELDFAAVAPVEQERLVEAPNVATGLEEWSLGLAACAHPSYLAGSVTGLAKSSGEVVLQRSSEGKGIAYGSLVHRCLQALGEGMDVDDISDFCRMAADEEGVEENWLEQAEKTVLLVTQSELWERSLIARRKYHEFSFMTNRQVVDDGSGVPIATLLRGVIDLVFKEDDGWVIVDFKTDRYEFEQEQKFVEFYKPQVKAYVEEWERMVGGKVKEAGLYFLNSNRYKPLNS
ncbi:UvrD-helicase domain-containing protein [Candidatus Pristimantibacillus sp. PTI5]|uniref:UvrD-helicase domain-containing protein n=1 Tax=Candidatus Pristimantibacillus sp. PTI5 TaxID=3400422 RepID=UPI003B013463